MIEVTYNNNIYLVDPNDSFDTLTMRGDLIGLPLSVWKEIFIKKDGTCSFTGMLRILLKQIDMYDNSSNVNGFYYKDLLLWLDKDTRMGLMNLANCSEDTVGVVLGSEIIEFPASLLKEYLKALEVYAGKCYLATAVHKLNVGKLSTIDELIAYDYTANYPQKLTIQ